MVDRGNGAWGCYLSHCKVLEDCLLEGIESVLILEDDVVFRPDFGVRTRQFLAALPCDWQMIYFGGENIEWDKGLPEPINAEVFRPRNVNRTHAYAIRGREMISSVLQHLKAWDKWTARHHIDHHLGAFQANTNSEGLYAPRRWLVDQAGGLSDVSNQRVQHRAFPDCEDLVFPRFDRELTVVLGPYSSGTSAVSAVLNALGIGFMGGEPPSVDKKGTKLYEHYGLQFLCRKIFSEPCLVTSFTKIQIEKLLRAWSGCRAEEARRHGEGKIGAKHPLLCFLGNELESIWPFLRIVVVDRDEEEINRSLMGRNWGWSVEECINATRTLVDNREYFLARTQSPVFRINYSDLLHKSQETILSLGDFCNTSASPDQQKLALDSIRRSEKQ